MDIIHTELRRPGRDDAPLETKASGPNDARTPATQNDASTRIIFTGVCVHLFSNRIFGRSSLRAATLHLLRTVAWQPRLSCPAQHGSGSAWIPGLLNILPEQLGVSYRMALRLIEIACFAPAFGGLRNGTDASTTYLPTL
ncbi:hypothetical protein C8Q78DRAFT_784652 [Trametes maxima]|nr:hypothetical protein C8Q78DRAFT_784652 [Trametes maxima]